MGIRRQNADFLCGSFHGLQTIPERAANRPQPVKAIKKSPGSSGGFFSRVAPRGASLDNLCPACVVEVKRSERALRYADYE